MIRGSSLAEIVPRVIHDWPMRSSVFAALNAILRGHEPIAPVKKIVSNAIGSGAAGVLSDLGQIAIADAVREGSHSAGHQAASRLGPSGAQRDGGCILQQLVATGIGGVDVVTGGARHACG